MSTSFLPPTLLRATIAWGLLASVLTAASGCGESEPPNARVSGKVVVAGGIPLTEGKLTLVPEEPVGNLSPPGATIQSDGTFDCYSSRGGAGIPPGKYKVLLSFPSGMGSTNPLNRTFRKYTTAETTPLTLDVPPEGLKDVVLEVEDEGAAEESPAESDSQPAPEKSATDSESSESP